MTYISGGKFNEEKLDWINKEHIKRLSPDELEKNIFAWLPKELQLKKIIPLVVERISKFGDIKEMVERGELDYFYKKPDCQKEKLIFKDTNPEVIINNLKEAIEVIEKTEESDFNKENIKIMLMELADNRDNRGEVLHPVRMALSGLDKSPDPFVLAEILGKQETIARLNQAIQILGKV